MAAASVVLLLIGFGTFYVKERNNPEWVSVATVSGQLKDVYLPDSTLVSMAGNSTLRYDSEEIWKGKTCGGDDGKSFFPGEEERGAPLFRSYCHDGGDGFRYQLPS